MLTTCLDEAIRKKQKSLFRIQPLNPNKKRAPPFHNDEARKKIIVNKRVSFFKRSRSAFSVD